MNKVYSITYDLKTPGRDYDSLFAELKKSSKWWHYLESTWLIATEETPAKVYERLVSKISNKDRLLIIEVRNHAQGWLPKDAWVWINQNVQP
jgi:hypothetical protein